MFTLSFVLEDWAVQELVNSPRHRQVAMMLTASSYVTWTYQTHTFSNAIETLLVLWSLVLITRIMADKDRTSFLTCTSLAFLLVVGVFNRITFPAYFLFPAFKLLSHFRRRPLSLFIIAISGIIFTSLAISLDTSFYHSSSNSTGSQIVITPLNSLLYNSRPSNLAKHGLHPLWTHVLVNGPLLLGPVFFLVIFGWYRKSMRLGAAFGGVLMLSAFPHQEARFLIPAAPLILSATRIPNLGKKFVKVWCTIWVIWNLLMGVLMGVYHQGGVVPMQIHIASTSSALSIVEGAAFQSKVFWWRTYMTPLWLLDGQIGRVDTIDMMGAPWEEVKTNLEQVVPTCKRWTKTEKTVIELVAPYSSIELDALLKGGETGELVLKEIWRYGKHISLDDLDIPSDGIWGTLKKVWGRRGLVLWRVERRC
jgi:GPI mannosyltransferase 4